MDKKFYEKIKALIMSELIKKKYEQLLPQSYPFLLVDKVVSVNESEIEALKNVSYNENFFQGHFPGKPVMPGVLMVEALAQASGIILIHSHGGDENPLFLFAGINSVRFKGMVLPGDQLILKSQLVRHKVKLFKFKCAAYVADHCVCDAELLLVEEPKT